MAKNDVKQLNYTVDEINEGLKNSLELGLQYSNNNDSVQLVSGTDNKKILGEIKNPGAEKGGLTLKYVDERTLRIYNTNGSTDEEDWTPVGDEVLIISADPDAVSYKFDFTPVSTTEPQIFVKESVDKDIQNTQWQILYKIKQVDNKGNIMFDPVDVTWTIKVNNNTRTFKETINYTVSNLEDTRSFNWINAIYKDTNFYGVGEYTIQGRFVGIDGIVASRTWRVSLTSLTFGSSFSEEKIYKEKEITVPYDVQGNMSKTVSGILVNKESLEEINLGSISHIASTYKQTGNFTIRNLTHGVYALHLYCVGLNGSIEVSAPDIYKEFIFVEDGNNTPLIRWSYPEDIALQQYTRTEFKYGVYNPLNTVTDIMIELFSENNNTSQTRTITPNNTTYSWFYYPTKGETTTKEFSITTKDLVSNISAIKNLLVKPFDGAEKIMAIEGVSFDFNPIGRTNYDANRDEYIFNNKNYLIPSDNFDWANGGWIQENIGTADEPQIVDAFLIKAGSSITLDYNIFEAAKSGESLNDMTLKNGKNMKFIFKTTNCKQMTAPIMVCKGENNTGLILNSQNAEIYYRADASQAAINLPYVEEEIVELEYNIESETHNRKPLLVSYISSDPSQTVTCELTPSGQSGQWTQDNPQPLVFGSEYCDIYLYRIKVYDRELSDAEIMQNYYADAFDGTTAYQRYTDNDILLENGDIDIEKLKQKYPELRILKIDCKDVWSNGKKDYREAYVEHYYPNGRLKDNWKANVGISIQGTSSVEYLTSAGNFDIDFRCKKIENPREVGIKYLFEDEYYSKAELAENPKADAAQVAELLDTEYAMTDNSIPVNYINVKVNIASSENANNARLAEWYHNYNGYLRRVRKYNSKIRDTMEFHPCVVFIRENAGLDNREFDNDGNYHFYACGDFGNSKKNNNALGMGEEAQYIVNELIDSGVVEESERETKVQELQAKECIVEVSNNIHDICRFKTAIFEDYQVSYDDKKGVVVQSDLWGGDAVEFRYCSNEDDTSLVKAETLKLWKWVYSIDATTPGRNEILISDVVRTEEGSNIVYTLKTPIPYTDDFVIKNIAPNFLFNITEGGSVQTFSKYDVEKFVTDYLKSNFINHCTFYHGSDGCYEIELKLPKANLTYENFNGWVPKFFISFTSKYVLNWTSDITFEITGTEDTAQYRNNKFKAEYENYFEKSSLLYFYLFTERFTMIDNRAKNTFIHFDGLKWNYSFDYDNDTALGCNNRGYLTMDYGVEDIDNADGYPLATHGGDPAFNANDAVLWVSVRNNLYAELQQQYNNSSLAWSSASMNNDFETYQNYKCNWLQMIDMRRKYLRPYTYGHGPSTKEKIYEEKYLPMLQGRKTLQRRRYQKYQELYFESKYTQTTTHNQFTFRAAYSEIGPVIIPYIKCYPIIDWDDVAPYTQRTWPGEEYKTPKRDIQNDLNFTIYPAKYISAVNGLNNAGVKSASMGNGIKLTAIDLSDNPNLPSGENAKVELSGDQTLLTRLNLKNTGATIVPSLSELTNIKYVNTEDTKVTSIIFANGCLVEEAYLGSLTELLSCINNSNLQTLSIQLNDSNTYNLKEIVLNNPSTYINWIELVNLELCPNLKQLTILNVNYNTNNCWNFEDNSWIEAIYESDINASLSGNIYINHIRKSDYDKYIAKWPGLKIAYNVDDGFIIEHKIVFKDYMNNELLSYFVDSGTATLSNPKDELGDRLNKPADAHYTYSFDNWSPADFDSSGNYIGAVVLEDREYVATYSSEVRKYTVTFNAIKDNQTQTFEVEYGADVVRPQFDLTSYYDSSKMTAYAFKYWDGSSSNITKNTVINAVWESANNATIDITPAKLLYLKRASSSGLTGHFEAGDRIKIQMNKQVQFNNIDCINIIDTPTYFDGTTYRAAEDENGPINLNYDGDWTVLVEYKPLGEGALFGWSDNTKKAVSIGLSNNVMVKCLNSSYLTTVSNYTNTQRTTSPYKPQYQRDVIVLTHKANTSYLTVYQCAPWENQSKTSILDGFMKPTTQSKITLGGLVQIATSESGAVTEKPFEYGTGIIYQCKLWPNTALQQSECKELVAWTSEEISFDVVGEQTKTVTDQAYECNLELMTSGTLHFPRIADTDIGFNSGNSWKDLGIYTWLNQRVYASLPIAIKSLMYQCDIPSFAHGSTITTNVSAHCWLPAFSNLQSTTNPAYQEDVVKFPIMTTNESTFRWSNAWSANYFSSPDGHTILNIKPDKPQNGDMYLSASDMAAERYGYIQIYNDLEWNSQFYYGSIADANYGPCYWLRTPHSTSNVLGFLHARSTSVDYDSNNAARAVVFCIAI